MTASTTAETGAQAASLRPGTPRPASALDAIFDADLLRKPATSSFSTAKSSGESLEQPSRRRRLSRSERKAPLPAEAEALKQQILRKWPVPLFRFRLRAMRRMVVSPVQIPSDLTNARAWATMVSGIQVPLTRRMHERQKARLLDVRVPDTIDERAAFA